LVEWELKYQNDFSTDPGIYGQTLPSYNYYEWDSTNKRINYKFKRYSGKHYYRRFFDLGQTFSLPIKVLLDITVDDNYAPDRFGNSVFLGLSDTNLYPDTTRTCYNKRVGLELSDDPDAGASNTKGVIKGYVNDKTTNLQTDTWKDMPEGETKTMGFIYDGATFTFIYGSETQALDVSALALPSSFKYFMYLWPDNDFSNPYQIGHFTNLRIYQEKVAPTWQPLSDIDVTPARVVTTDFPAAAGLPKDKKIRVYAKAVSGQEKEIILDALT